MRRPVQYGRMLTWPQKKHCEIPSASHADSGAEAARSSGVSKMDVSKVVRGINKSGVVKGWCFRYAQRPQPSPRGELRRSGVTPRTEFPRMEYQ